jgi:hypothetical protein
MKEFLLLIVTSLILHASTYTAFGDSITDRGSSCGDATAAANCYADIVAAKENWLLNDQGIGGAQAADQAVRIYNTTVPAIGSPRYSFMIGTNDNWGYGQDANKQADFQAINLAELAFLAIPESNKIRPFDSRVNYNGYGWWLSSLYGGGIKSVFCGNPGSSMSIHFAGTVLYLSMGMQDGNNGQFTVSLDGHQIGTFGAYGKNHAAINTVVYHTKVAPQLIRLTASPGRHTATITVLSPTIFFDWAATAQDIDTAEGPLVVAGGPPLQRTDNHLNGYPAWELQKYGDMVKANVALLAGDGLNIRYADTTATFANSGPDGTPLIDHYIDNPYDDVHPNNAGQAALAQTILLAFNSHPGQLPDRPISNGTYILKNAYSGMVLDDPAFSVTTGTQIIQWWLNSGPNQKWVFTFLGNGYYSIMNRYSGLYLTDSNGKLEESLPANSDSQLWSLNSLGSNQYAVVNKATSRLIDDANVSRNAGNGMITWANNGGSNQEWILATAP